MKLLHFIRNFIIRILHPNRYSSDAYKKHLLSKGCIIGEGTYFFSPLDTQIDVSRPYLLEIGKYCKITSGVHILTHDYSRSVLRLKYKEIIESAKYTKIGDNVFIGIKTIILPGVTIGNNVIIGAGSVVVKDIPDDVVVGGNPAKIIMSIDDYKKNRERKYLDEAVLYAQRIKKITGKNPTMADMGDFFPLFYSGTIDNLKTFGVNVRCNGDNKEDYNRSIQQNKPKFKDFNEFLNYIDKKENSNSTN